MPYNKFPQKIQWYEVYANSQEPGDKKFYINGQTGVTEGGGPADFHEIKPYEANFEYGNSIAVKPYSLNYFVLMGTEVTTRLQDQEEIIRLYPNPSQDKIYLDSSTALEYYTILSLDGRIICQEKINGNTVDISSLDRGIYCMKVKTPYCTESMQFIKN